MEVPHYAQVEESVSLAGEKENHVSDLHTPLVTMAEKAPRIGRRVTLGRERPAVEETHYDELKDCSSRSKLPPVDYSRLAHK